MWQRTVGRAAQAAAFVVFLASCGAAPAWAASYQDPRDYFSITVPEEYRQAPQRAGAARNAQRLADVEFTATHGRITITLEPVDPYLAPLMGRLARLMRRREATGHRLAIDEQVQHPQYTGTHIGYELNQSPIVVHEYALFPPQRGDYTASLIFICPVAEQERLLPPVRAAVESFRFGSLPDAASAARGRTDWRSRIGRWFIVLFLGGVLELGAFYALVGLLMRQWSIRQLLAYFCLTWCGLSVLVFVPVTVVLLGVARVLPPAVALPLAKITILACAVGVLYAPIHFFRRLYQTGWFAAIGMLLLHRVAVVAISIGALLLVSGARPSQADHAMESFRTFLQHQMMRLRGHAPPPVTPPAAANPPPALPAAPAVRTPALRLMGVIFSKGKASALINEKILTPGDQIEGYTVTKIEHGSVTVTSETEKLILRVQ